MTYPSEAASVAGDIAVGRKLGREETTLQNYNVETEKGEGEENEFL